MKEEVMAADLQTEKKKKTFIIPPRVNEDKGYNNNGISFS